MRGLLAAVAAIGLIAQLAAAQTSPGASEVGGSEAEIEAKTGDLAASARELAFETLELEFPAGALEGPVQDLAFVVVDLAGKRKDLEVKESKTEIHIDLAADVLFDFDKAMLKPEAQQALKQAAGIIRDNAKGTVRIEGHTDAKGSDAYNQKLSDNRAKAVRDWLVNKEGLKSVKFATQGFGAKRPVAPNTKPDGSDDPEGRQKNRRVEIILSRR